MNASDLMKIKAQAAEQLRLLDTSYRPSSEQSATRPRYGPYHQAAAVLSTFDSETLRPTDVVTEDDSVEDVLADSILVKDAHSNSRWALLSEVRREVLQQMENREAMQRALDTNSDRPNDPAQKMLEAYIRGDAPPLEQQDAEQVAGTFQVAQWLTGVLDNLPDQEAIQRRNESLSLLEPFEDLAVRHFRGREKELQRLRDYVGVLPPGSVHERLNRIAASIFNLQEKPPLMIHGPGGVGKSALVARFIWEHATLPETEHFPWVYIDFDRPGLLAEEPLTLLIEGVSQLGIQYPQARTYCDRIRTDWQRRLVRRLQQEKGALGRVSLVKQTFLGATTSSPQEWDQYLRDFAILLGNLKVETDPFLFVLDTFEEVQYRSDVVVAGLAQFLTAFQRHVPRLRTVLAGRAPIKDVTDLPTQEVELGDFDAAAAQGFLEAHGVTPPEVAQAIATQVQGNPLSLKLAVDVWRLEGADTSGIARLQTRNWIGFRLKENEIQGQLFARILSHIHDRIVHKLAHPGLVLRRVTPELIREVLAGPCGVVIKDPGEAKRLFEELRQEVSLVTFEDGALRHRPDVRRIMINLLRESEPDKVKQIEEAAVAYYEKQEGVVARAEEIYHRLSLKQPGPVLDGRWIDGVQPYLYSALEELNVCEKAWLASRLRVPLDLHERQMADLEG